jgi:twinkle protein
MLPHFLGYVFTVSTLDVERISVNGINYLFQLASMPLRGRLEVYVPEDIMTAGIESALRNIGDVSEGVNRRIICPECGHTRKKKGERTLSVKREGDSLLWHCWHCDSKGKIDLGHQKDHPPVARQPKPKQLSVNAIRFLNSRGISRATAEKYRVFSTEAYFRKLGRKAEAIGFPYFNSGVMYACKLRCIEEKDHIQAGSCQTLWGLDLVGDTSNITIVEGELDALALSEAGVENVVSVPAGAPNTVPVDGERDRRFTFLQHGESLLNEVSDIYLAGDTDKPGEILMEELARRVGKHRCWKVTWPDGLKDANASLLQCGKEATFEAWQNAERYPVAGLYEPSVWYDQLDHLFVRGAGKGKSTGYPAVDAIYTVVPGSLTIVTGIPGSGKSEFLDQLAVKLSDREDWPIGIVSPENEPSYHLVKLIQKRVRAQFFVGAGRRMSREQLEEAKRWIEGRFVFCYQSDGTLNTVEGILERLRVAVVRYGIRMAVIDPVNYIEQPGQVQETKWVSDMLSKFRAFAQHHEVALFLVAHPRTMYRDKEGKMPNPDGFSISGSAHYFNKADFGLTITRPDPMLDPDLVSVTCWKCRHSWAGRLGSADLSYDEETTCYYDRR